MRSLEEIARDLFTEFSTRKLGRKVRWDLLSKERKDDWMEDAFIMLDEILDLVGKEIDTPIPFKSPAATFEAGMLKGMERERERLRGTVGKVRDKYLDDLKDFIG